MKVGDVMWVQGERQCHYTGPVTITKVGRIWVQATSPTGSYELRFHKDTRRVDSFNGGEIGTVYRDAEQALEHRRAQRLWRDELSSRWDLPRHITEADVRSAAARLGMKLGDA